MSELGEELRRARLERKMSLEEIQELTKIQKRYLESIEEGEFDKLPGPFYTKAFVKSYADAVGLNDEVLLSEYGHELPELSQTVESLPPRRTRTTTRSAGGGKLLSALPGLLIFGLVIGVFAVIWMLSINKNDNSSQIEEPNAEEQSVEVKQNEKAISENDKKAASEKEEDEKDSKEDEKNSNVKEESGSLELLEASGDTSTFNFSGAEQVEATFNFSGDSWLKINGGSGKTYVNEGFSKGDKESFDFSDESTVRVRIGNATNLELLVNEQQVEFQTGIVAQTIKINFDEASE